MIKKLVIIGCGVFAICAAVFAAGIPIPKPFDNLPITTAQKEALSLHTVYKPDDATTQQDNQTQKRCRCAITSPNGSVVRTDCACVDQTSNEDADANATQQASDDTSSTTKDKWAAANKPLGYRVSKR